MIARGNYSGPGAEARLAGRCLARLLAVLAGLLAVLLITQVALPLTSAARRVQGLQAATRGSALPAEAQAILLSMAVELGGLERDLRAVEAAPLTSLIAHLGSVPGIGYTLESAPALIRISRHTAHAGQLACQGLAPAAEGLAAQGNDGAVKSGLARLITPDLLARLADGQASFNALQEDLTAIQSERRALDASRLVGPVAQALVTLDQYLPALRLLSRSGVAAEMLPGLLGLSEPRTYLLLAQNWDELRATGGFISSVGTVRLEDATVRDLDFRDSYAVDDLSLPYPPAPDPLATYMRAGLWLTRDANWSPDFPTSARAAERLFRIGQSTELDGVIGVDTGMVRLLVEALEPLLVEPYGQTVHLGNLTAMLRQYYGTPIESDKPGDAWSHRKDFSGALLRAILTKLQGSLTAGEALGLLAAVEIGFEERHLQMYVKDARAARWLAQFGWDGSLRPSDDDYLMVVDANMGYNKVNGRIRQSIDYVVRFSGRGTTAEVQALATLTVTYENTSEQPTDRCVQRSRDLANYDALTQGCYWNYLRVYAPADSRLVTATPLTLPGGSLLAQAEGTVGPLAPEVTGENDRSVFGFFFVVPPGSEKVITLTYELPGSGILDQTLSQQSSAPTDQRYSLIVQKQAGTEALPIRVSVAGPPGWRVAGAQPNARLGDSLQVVMEGNLATDRHFDVLWEVLGTR